MICIMGDKKSALRTARTIVDTSIISMGVRTWLASSSLNTAATVKVAVRFQWRGVLLDMQFIISM